jgi:hypothetical protein
MHKPGALLITINSATLYSVMPPLSATESATECNVMPPSI